MSIHSDGGANLLRFDDTVGPGFVFNYDAPYTVCFWYKPGAVAGGEFKVALYVYDSNFGSTDDYIGQYDAGSGTKIHIEADIPGTNNNAQGTTSLVSGTWYHFAFRRSSVTAAQGLLNGSVQPSMTVTPDVTGRTTADTVLFFGSNSGENPVSSITQARVWETALTDGEITTEMNSATVVKAGAWANWPLANNTDVADISGNARDLRIYTGSFTTDDNPTQGGGGTPGYLFLH